MNRLLNALLLLSAISISFSFSYPPAELGVATFYNDSFHGRKTACSGELYDKNKLTAAHRTLPCGTMVKVTQLDNKKSVVVRINDRGPYIKGQVLQISRKAAETLDLVKKGEGRVKLEIIKAPESSKVAVKTKAATTKAKTAVKEKEPKLNILKEATEIETGGLYKMQVLKLEPKGFGVQVAGYSDYEAVMRQVATLQKNWFKGAMVFVDNLNGKPYYKVIMGPFFTKQEADSYRLNLQKKYKVKDAFVVNLEEMKASK